MDPVVSNEMTTSMSPPGGRGGAEGPAASSTLAVDRTDDDLARDALDADFDKDTLEADLERDALDADLLRDALDDDLDRDGLGKLDLRLSSAAAISVSSTSSITSCPYTRMLP